MEALDWCPALGAAQGSARRNAGTQEWEDIEDYHQGSAALRSPRAAHMWAVRPIEQFGTLKNVDLITVGEITSTSVYEVTNMVP